MKLKSGVKTTNKHIAVALAIFGLSLSLLYVLFSNLPPLSASEWEKIRFPPRAFQDVKNLAIIGEKYTQEYYYTVLSTIAVLYIFLQSFSIPGSIGLSFITGALFGVRVAFPVVILCATIGPTVAYCISYYLGTWLVNKIFPRQMEWFAGQVRQRRSKLFNFLLFLRLTPFLPNMFINLASPLLKVPLHYFVFATFFGIMPATFMHIMAGQELLQMTEFSGFNWKSFALLTTLGCVVMLPTLEPVQRFIDRVLNRGAPVVAVNNTQ